MIRAFIPLILSVTAATAQDLPAGMIDASDLSVAELIALAVAERDRATELQCCDWSGGGCLAHVKSVEDMASTPVGPEG